MRTDEELKQDPLFIEAKGFVDWYRGEILQQLRTKIISHQNESKKSSG